MQKVLSKGPSYVPQTMLLFQPWTHEFSFNVVASLEVPILVEFIDTLWPFICYFVNFIGSFVCNEPTWVFSSKPSRCMCAWVDMAKTLKEYIEIQVGATQVHQWVVYVNLPNTCFRSQSPSHHIRDYPLIADKFKSKVATVASKASALTILVTRPKVK